MGRNRDTLIKNDERGLYSVHGHGHPSYSSLSFSKCGINKREVNKSSGVLEGKEVSEHSVIHNYNA